MYVVVGIKDCKYCDYAKRLLKEFNLNYEFVDKQTITSQQWNSLRLLAEKKMKGRVDIFFHSVPQVFQIVKNQESDQPEGEGAEYIGGFTELQRKILQPALNEFCNFHVNNFLDYYSTQHLPTIPKEENESFFLPLYLKTFCKYFNVNTTEI